jgi:long-subunit acyl-CoA synthetase (AMP-forming)
MAGLEHRLKTEKSLARKIQNDSVEYNGNVERAADNINDAVRYTLLFEPDVYTESAIKTIDGMRDAGYQFERIKNFLVKREPFSIENGDMTITLKVKRKVVMEKYAAEIEAMYAQTDCPL